MRVCKQIDYSAIFKIVLKMAEFPLMLIAYNRFL